MIWFMQIKYISIIPACVYVCKGNALYAIMQKFLSLNSPRPLPVLNPTHCWFDIHKVTETGTKW